MRAAIFVIDDQREVAESTARFLRKEGHEVLVETDGHRALAVLGSAAQFDVTFLDVLMPYPNGAQIYNVLKEKAPARLERLVFYTGMGYLAEHWLRATGLPIIEKGAVTSPGELLKWVKHFSELSCSKGPMPDNGPIPMPIDKKKKPSLPDLSDLIGDDDDEDSGDDTGVFAATLERHTQHDGADHAVVVAAVKYVHRKNTKLAKRVKQLEEENERLQNDGVKGTVASRVRILEDRWNKLIWMAMGAAVGGGGLTVGIWKLIEKAVVGH